MKGNVVMDGDWNTYTVLIANMEAKIWFELCQHIGDR